MKDVQFFKQHRPDTDNTYSGVEILPLHEKITEGVMSILDQRVEEILQEAEITQKLPRKKLPEHILHILEPLFSQYTTRTKEDIIKIFSEEEIKAAPRKQKPLMKKSNDSGGKKMTLHKSYTAYMDVLKRVKQNFVVTERDMIVHTLGFSYIWNNLPSDIFNEYLSLYQENLKGVRQMYQYMEEYVENTISPYLQNMIREGINIENSVAFQDLLKKLYVEVCFPNAERPYVIFPVYVKAILFRKISAIRRTTDKTEDSQVLYHHINGILAEIHGNYMMNSLAQTSNNALQAHQIDLDQNISDSLNIAQATDAVYVVTAPDQTRYVYCVDFKNHDTAEQIIFGEENIVQLYASDGKRWEKSVYDENGAIKERPARLFRMLEGIHDVLGFDKRIPVRVLAIKAGLTNQDHFTPQQLEKRTQAFYEEFMQNQFPNYMTLEK